MFYKRKRMIAFIVVFACMLLCGCNKVPSDNDLKVYNGFSVHYIDVGESDAVFINFGDNKTMLIDTGKDEEDYNLIYDYLKKYSVSKIDYFVLTHPDENHIGNGKRIISDFDIGTVYMPYILQNRLDYFPVFKEIFLLVNSKNINSKISDFSVVIKGKNYGFAFLLPEPFEISGSAYDGLNSDLPEGNYAIKDVSPIIYLDYKGTRFLFTGDVSEKQEKLLVTNYNSGIYKVILNDSKITLNLHNIDYLKVANHGDNGSSCEKFLSLIKPKNAIISVGGNNYNGHPGTEVLNRLNQITGGYNLYRTDVHGNIVCVEDENGKISVKTDID